MAHHSNPWKPVPVDEAQWEEENEPQQNHNPNEFLMVTNDP